MLSGVGGGGKSPVEADGKLQPDVIVTDISMPKLTGMVAADRLTESGSSSKIVFSTVHTDPDSVQPAIKTDALAYVSRLRINTDLLVAIDEALAGAFLFPHRDHRREPKAW
jgi:DNA-binding NarL/FixJ family response regulator